MSVPDVSTKLGDGVYYRQKDYASFFQRLTANLIDAIVLYLAMVVLAVVVHYLYYNLGMFSLSEEVFAGLIFAVACLVPWSYLTICKASSLRTVGYRMAGLKIVNLTGQSASWYQMTFRMFLWICGPFSMFLDSVWVFTDEARQTCRDCYCGTLVVQNKAVPQGTAPLILTLYNVLGLTLIYKRTKPVTPKSA